VVARGFREEHLEPLAFEPKQAE